MTREPLKPGDIVRYLNNTQCFVVKTVWKSMRKRAAPTPGRIFVTGGPTENIWMASISILGHGAVVGNYEWRCEAAFLKPLHPLEALALQAE